MPEPGEIYTSGLEARTAAREVMLARERKLSIARLVIIAITIVAAFRFGWLALVPLAAFVAMLPLHERTIRARRRADAGAAFFTRGLERLNGTWQGRGDAGDEFNEDHHPYAGDFDLFGRGSLFERISLAVTRAGRQRLASWLKEPARDADAIRARQEAVLELRENVALREDLAVAAREVSRDVEAAHLDAWAALPAITFSAWERVVLLALPAIAVVLISMSMPDLAARLINATHDATVQPALRMPLWPLLVVIVAIIAMTRHLAPRVAPIVTAVERAEPALALLAQLLERIEKEQFVSKKLRELLARLSGASGASPDGSPAAEAAAAPPASLEIERLRKLVALLDARRNQFFIPFAGLLLWTPNIALRVERWRQRSGTHVGEWIESVGEIEALSSLASFAFEHPTFAMPEIAGHGFAAKDLGHPLIPADRRVTNDLTLGGELRLLIVSGSNMSGKSTMMRSVGIAAVLAMAGSVVCARALRIGPMAVGASIRINDSLQEGASRFYAEILRIRQILEMAAREPAMLFLLDEVLAGTNSHDRRIGAAAIVRGLVERGAVGLMSTHDLALAQIADDLAPRATNVHFEDHLEDGKVVFDYRMRPGVVTKSNALALMRSVGIDV